MNSSRQSGNVLFIIFIGIALFAALSFAVSRGMRSGGESVSKEKTSLSVNELIQYSNAVSQSIKAIKALNGCTDTQINFANTIISGYSNASAPADGSCNIFEQQGGGLTYQTPDDKILDPAYQADAAYRKWLFTGRFCVNSVGTGVGSTCAAENAELLMILPYINNETCNKLVEMMGNPNAPSANTGFANYFTGTYGTVPMNSSMIVGKRFGCYSYNGLNAFFFVLLAR